MWYDSLNEKMLWKYFDEISSVPRNSGREEKIRAYLLSWAEKNGVYAVSDAAGNVIMKKSATKGYENRASIALQGHMDMVCVKREGSKHDFETDPIEIVLEDNGVIHAKDTTLGADNGIAIATILTLFTDENWEHGPLEAICTVNEEVGLTGASGLEGKYVDSRILINLDNEDEGTFCIGCAGGLNVEEKTDVESAPVTDGEALFVEISDLNGGHSGGDIDKGRCNAIMSFARYLSLLPSYRLVSVSGGTKHNVIPSYLRAVIVVPSAEEGKKTASLLQKDLRTEFIKGDGSVRISALDTETPKSALIERDSKRIADALLTSPNGVQSYSQTVEGIVETSCNLAVINVDSKKADVLYSIRSSIESSKKNLALIIMKIYEKNGFTSFPGDGYPGWQPNPSSPLVKGLSEAYREVTGKDPEIKVIHAGLECGVINSRVPGMDSISMGPSARNVHTVDESLEATSAERVLNFLRVSLKRLC